MIPGTGEDCISDVYYTSRIDAVLRHIRQAQPRHRHCVSILQKNERLKYDGGDYYFYIDGQLHLKVYGYYDIGVSGTGYIVYTYSGDNAVMTCYTDKGETEHVATVKYDQVDLPCED
jgi:hypothetical protein